MEQNQEPAISLNSSQKLHLLKRCEYADKLLGDIESILVAAASKSPFPKYKPDISPAQAKVVRDYIARIRAQMVRVLESQGIQPGAPQFGSVHSIRVALGFSEISFDECRPQNMRGYGEVPESIVPELNGLVDEMKGLLARLDGYLAQGAGQDLQLRLDNLQRAGSDVSLVTTLERIINSHGLVEYRPALAHIVSRLESTSFEIAVFGRVSSGKSSLLNHIVQADVLPVGVTPVTAVPTRVVYGPAARAIAWFADRGPEQFEIGRLREFATEQCNPANWKHVTRIVVELPSSRLRDGIVYVDTPGLGSLASAGAAETMAYLPRCDLGVVLIDAGSTLTEDDLSTIRTLYEAGVPAFLLLSKADLLAADDQERVRQYVGSHLRSELGLDLPVHPVSVKPERAELLERWFEGEILPLYDRHMELSRQSLNRKTGALRAEVELALRSRLKHSERTAEADGPRLRTLETDLRRTAGRFADVRVESLRITDEIWQWSDAAIERAAAAIIEAWQQNGAPCSKPETIIAAVLEQTAAQQTSPIAFMLKDLALDSARVLAGTAAELGLQNPPPENELTGVVKEMPRLDTGRLEISVRPGLFGLRMGATQRVQKQIKAQVGRQVAAAFAGYEKMLGAWVRRTFAELQARFDVYADAYRAQLGRLNHGKPGTAEEEETIRRDLAAICAPEPEAAEKNARVPV